VLVDLAGAQVLGRGGIRWDLEEVGNALKAARTLMLCVGRKTTHHHVVPHTLAWRAPSGSRSGNHSKLLSSKRLARSAGDLLPAKACDRHATSKPSDRPAAPVRRCSRLQSTHFLRLDDARNFYGPLGECLFFLLEIIVALVHASDPAARSADVI
jgi:hypothetical protein